MQTAESKNWHALPEKEVFERLDSCADGLASAAAAARLHQFGPNQLKEKPRPPAILEFLRQFKSTPIVMLIVAAAIALAIGEVKDSVVIMVVIVFNAVWGFIQESKAEKAMAALRKLTSPKARVLRDGEMTDVPAPEVVPGDVLLLEEGARVCADVRLFAENALEIDESTLTGESVPVKKKTGALDADAPTAERYNSAFMGTVVTRGKGSAVVTATGGNTELGRIAKFLEEREEKTTPLSQKLDKLAKQIGVIAVVLCTALFAFEFFRYYPHLTDKVKETLLISISLAVAIIPEGLPVVVLVTLALGMQQMAKRNAIIRRLMCVETLGSTTVICSDKTGTLTRNEMTVREICLPDADFAVAGAGYDPAGRITRDGQVVKALEHTSLKLLIEIGALCNNARIVREGAKWKALGDPTEAALVTLAKKSGMNVNALDSENPRAHEIVFDTKRKMMTVIRNTPQGSIAFVKGAPEAVLGVSSHVLLENADRHGFSSGVSLACAQEGPNPATPSEYPPYHPFSRGGNGRFITCSQGNKGQFPPFPKGGREGISSGHSEVLTAQSLPVQAGSPAETGVPANATAAATAPLSESLMQRLLAQNTALAAKTYRVLAFAFRKLDGDVKLENSAEVEKDCVFAGMVGIYDPPRTEVAEVIKQCAGAGIRVVMITGDQKAAALAIAKELGILQPGDAVLTGADVDKLDQARFQEMVEDVSVYARVLPEHKMRIVQALAATGHVVAMTGDGVNDAPALKEADIGISMGITGSDVAIEASDMVLMDDNFVTIVAAIEEGRKIFDNIRRFVSYNITTNIGGIILIFGAALLGLPLPLFAVQLLWINIMMDGPPAVALGVEPTLQNVMKRQPIRMDERILSGPIVFRIVSLALLMGALNLLLYYWVFTCGPRAGAEGYARTMVLTSFIMFQMFSAMNYRSEEHSVFLIGFFRNRMIVVAIAASVLLHLLVVYLPALQGFFHTTPLSKDDWLVIMPLSASVFVFEEARKAIRRLFAARRAE